MKASPAPGFITRKENEPAIGEKKAFKVARKKGLSAENWRLEQLQRLQHAFYRCKLDSLAETWG
jgi:hypothetical protein